MPTQQQIEDVIKRHVYDYEERDDSPLLPELIRMMAADIHALFAKDGEGKEAELLERIKQLEAARYPHDGWL